jgi:hypothetical protein
MSSVYELLLRAIDMYINAVRTCTPVPPPGQHPVWSCIRYSIKFWENGKQFLGIPRNYTGV